MAIGTINLKTASFYEIKEHRFGNRAALLFDNNIGSYDYINEDKQKFLLIPLSKDRCNIISLETGWYWTMRDYLTHWSVRLEQAINGNPDNKWQTFKFNRRSNLDRGEPIFNIREFSNDEYVVEDIFGNFIRGGGDRNDIDKKFSLFQSSKRLPNNLFWIENLRVADESEGFNPSLKMETDPVTIETEVIPYHLINDESYINSRHHQFRDDPYYILRHEAFWRLLDGGYIEHDGIGKFTRILEATSGVKKSTATSIERTFSRASELQIGLELPIKILEATLKVAGNYKVSETQGLKVVETTTSEISSIQKDSTKIELSSGERKTLAFWQRVDRCSLINPDWKKWKVICLRAKSNRKLVAREDNTGLRAEGLKVGIEDKYRVVANADETISFKDMTANKYVSAVKENNFYLRASGLVLGIEDKYEVLRNSDDTFSFRSRSNNLWVSASESNGFLLKASSNRITENEGFQVIVISAEAFSSWEVPSIVSDMSTLLENS